MKKTIVLWLALLIMITGCSSAVEPVIYKYTSSNPNSLYYSNPITTERADPWIYEHTDGYYYMMASVPEYDRLELRRSSTITGLAVAEPKVVWEKNESGPMSKNIWAPEIFYIDGKWYIYFSAAKAESEFDHRMYVLENASANPLEGEWELKGQIRTGHEVFQIDASLFEHNETWYMMWSGAGAKGNTLYMAPLENPWTIAESRIMLTEPEFDWEKRAVVHVAEAPEVIKHKDQIFITYSASFCDANYNMGLLSANANSDLMDPSSWKKSSEPIFFSNEAANAYGPGHGSFVTSPDGTELIHVYHAVDGKGTGYGCDKARNVRIQTYTYDQNGQPQLGEPVSRGYNMPSPSGEARFELERYWNGEEEVVIASDAAFNGAVLQYNKKKQKVTVEDVIAPNTGIYTITLAYNNIASELKQTIEVNGHKYSLDLQSGEDKHATAVVELQGGANSISLPYASSEVQLDYMELAYMDIAASNGEYLTGMSLSRTDLVNAQSFQLSNGAKEFELPVPEGNYTVAIAYRNANAESRITVEANDTSVNFPITSEKGLNWNYSSVQLKLDSTSRIKVNVNGTIDLAYIRVLSALPENEELSFQNRQSGLLLQPNGGSKNAGDGYRQYLKTDAAVQYWTLEDAGEGNYYIKNSNSGLYMTATKDGVVQLELQQSDEQRWIFRYAEEGSYTIESVIGNVSPTSVSPDPVQHDNVLFEPLYADDTQIWKVQSRN